MVVLVRSFEVVVDPLQELMVTDDKLLTLTDVEQHILDKPSLLHLENNTSVR